MDNRAIDLANATQDAFSYDRYRSWVSVAALLLKRGYSMEEAEAIMRSKWVRWAADASNARYGYVPAKAVGAFLDKYETYEGRNLRQDVAGLVAGTF